MRIPEDATPRERELYAIIAELRANIAELKAELAKARKDSSNSSRPPSSDIVKPPKPPPPKGQKKRKRGGQPGHPRHERAAFPPEEVLTGTRFEDAVVNGSYRVDVHHPDKPGLTFRYLNGTEVYVSPTGGGKRGRWRDKADTDPTFYQVPYRSLVPKGAANLLVAGRCLDADRGAFGAVRVMVNCNQMGQAAGTAAYLSLNAGTTVDIVDVKKLRKTLEKEGAIVI